MHSAYHCAYHRAPRRGELQCAKGLRAAMAMAEQRPLTNLNAGGHLAERSRARKLRNRGQAASVRPRVRRRPDFRVRRQRSLRQRWFQVLGA